MKVPLPEPTSDSAIVAEVLARVTADRLSQSNVLCDGKFSLSYGDIPSLFPTLDTYFAAQGVKPGSCLALECINSVPGALTLLYLFAKGYHCVLLPPRGRSVGEVTVPRFCQFQIAIRSFLSSGSGGDLAAPATFLELSRNELFTVAMEQLETGSEGKLFLRTSGSLGSPKMVVHSYGRLLGNALGCVERLKLTSEDRIAIPVPIFHMYGLGAAFLPGFSVGASLDLQENANLLRYLERERQFKPTVAFLTPGFCSMFPQRGEQHYRMAVVAGDRLRKEAFPALETRFGRLTPLYGSTEMGAIAACEPTAPDELRVSTVGRPMPGVQLRIEKHVLEDDKDAGEIWCYHEYGCEGYVDPDGRWQRANASVGDGWYRTGDLGRMHAGEFLEVIGRRDHCVNRDGRLVAFAEIEQAMEGIGDLARVVIVRHGESRRGKGIVACCVQRGEVRLSAAEIRKACFGRLPNYAIPDEILILDALPTLPNGKIDRRTLQRLVQNESKSFAEEEVNAK